MDIVLAVNPVIAMLGTIAAIILCLFILVFVITALAFNLAMTFGLSWVREKAELVKLLRPNVDSVNKASESVLQGKALPRGESNIIRTVTQIPVQVNSVDKKVVQVSDAVAEKVIEYRARTMQAKAIVRTFFASRKTPLSLPASETRQEIESPGYRMLMEDGRTPGQSNVPGDQHELPVEQQDTAPQAKYVAHR